MTDRENIQAIERALKEIKSMYDPVYGEMYNGARHEVLKEIRIAEKNLNELKQRL